nr:MAG TPA: hypothetical protein [Caudoviricetes sp.]
MKTPERVSFLLKEVNKTGYGKTVGRNCRKGDRIY